MSTNLKVLLFFVLAGPKIWELLMQTSLSWLLWFFAIVGVLSALKNLAFGRYRREGW